MTPGERVAAIGDTLNFFKSQPLYPDCFSREKSLALANEAALIWAVGLVSPQEAKEKGLAVEVDLDAVIQAARSGHAIADRALRTAEIISRGGGKKLDPKHADYLASAPDISRQKPRQANQARDLILSHAVDLIALRYSCARTRGEATRESGKRDCACSIVVEALNRDGIELSERALEKILERKPHLRA